jgi:formylglycine-generating enzyme required for sulfatase activity
MYDPTMQKYGCGTNGTQPVGSRLYGDSPFSAKDMLGNVAEWTQERHWRGGNYYSQFFGDGLNTYSLGWDGPALDGNTYGFRCVK